MHSLLKGSYRDTLVDSQRRTLWEGDWRPNLMVHESNLLLASLMKRQEGIAGILYWAVGAGDPSWDGAVPSPQPANTQLTSEIARQAVAVEQIAFLDGDGQPTASPTNRLEVTAKFNGDELVESGFQPLREFAVFGGDASESPNTGFMIDQVIHPRIDMAPGMTLNRRLRLTFGTEESLAIAEIEPSGPVASLPLVAIDGVGEQYAEELGRLGVSTVGGLAGFAPLDVATDIPSVKLREFRAKCRMAMSLQLGFFPTRLIADRSVSDILRLTPRELAREMGTPGVEQEMAARLQAELDKLQVALDDSRLQMITIGEIVSDVS